MTALAQAQCEACRADAPKVSDEELAELIREIPDWNIEVRGDHMELERVFLFRNFRHALAFTNAVGAIAEEVGHHPALLTEWGKVTVTWWSHEMRGLHRNDFIMAARTDPDTLAALAEVAPGRPGSGPQDGTGLPTPPTQGAQATAEPALSVLELALQMEEQ